MRKVSDFCESGQTRRHRYSEILEPKKHFDAKFSDSKRKRKRKRRARKKKAQGQVKKTSNGDSKKIEESREDSQGKMEDDSEYFKQEMRKLIMRKSES